MMNTLDNTCWMYKNAGEGIHLVRVVKNGRVFQFPVKNSTEKVVRKAMRDMFGKLTYSVVEIFPSNDEREC